MTTFSLEECLAYDGPHCPCFTEQHDACCFCDEPAPPDDDLDDDDEGPQ